MKAIWLILTWMVVLAPGMSHEFEQIIAATYVLAVVLLAIAFSAGVGVATVFFLVRRRLAMRSSKVDNLEHDTARVRDAECDIRAHVDVTLEADVLKSLFGIHGILFQFLANSKANSWSRRIARLDPNFVNYEKFVTTFFDAVEGEIERNGFEINKPKEGDHINPSTMSISQTVECASDDKANRVAKVSYCGFRPVDGFGWDAVKHSVFQRSQVAIYKKAHPAARGNDT